jgi:CSLREA domain-containing protein
MIILASGCAKAGGLVVNSAGDAGDSDPGDEVCRTAASATECTLRAAIEEANAWAGYDSITFNLPAGSLTIYPETELPEITETVIIDATTQPGYVLRTTMVTVDGGSMPMDPSLDGLTIGSAVVTTLKGMVVQGFRDNGISNRGWLGMEGMIVSNNRHVGLGTGGGASVLPLTIADSDFLDNGSSGISSDMNDVTITGGTISRNGGGIGVSNGSLTMEGTQIQGNTGVTLSPFGGVGLYNSRGAFTNVFIDGNTSHDCGGGIEFRSDGGHVLTVADSTISRNTAYHGGGIELNGGTVRLSNTAVLDNTAQINGGGIRVLSGGAAGATLWVEAGSVIGQAGHGNTADAETHDAAFGLGGGIYSEARVEISNSVVEGNTGDGIYNNNGWLRLQGGVVRGNSMDGIRSISSHAPGTVQLTESAIEANLETGIDADNADLYFVGGSIRDNAEGGLMMNGGNLNLAYSTVSGNVHTADGRAGGGIGLYSMNDVRIQNSTISGNSDFNNGGGLYLYAATGLVQNVTISGNHSGNTGGGMVAASEGITLNNVTITRNDARFSGGILGTEGLIITNTIIAGNTAVNCAWADPVVSGGNNLDDDGTCDFTAAGDLSDADPMLGPLADNGGTTFTHALLPGSPAIDAGNDATCRTIDQRNIVRPQGPHCDIGAFELVSGDATPTPTATPYRATDTPTPTTGVSPILFDPVEFSSETVFKGGKTCEPLTLTVRVKVSPADQVAGVALYFRIVSKLNGQTIPWNEGLKMTKQGGGWYELTLSGDDLPNIYQWQSDAWLDIQFVANGSDYLPIARSDVIRKITYQPCYN